MKHNLIKFLVFGLGLTAYACSPAKRSTSETKEAIDNDSRLSKLDSTNPAYFYDGISQTKVVESHMPWADTYWATYAKGLAIRWNDSKSVGIGDYFKTHFEASDSESVDPNLSPADKYDILWRWRNGIKLDSTKFSDTFEKWNKFEETFDPGVSVWNKALNDFETEDTDPWSAFYSSLSDEKKKEFDSFYATSKSNLNSIYTEFKSDAFTQLRNSAPLSSGSWNDFLKGHVSRGNQILGSGKGSDWSWEGICHGWAPAAIMEETPKQSVMVKYDNKQMLVTEGDVRGLLSKSWASYRKSGKQYFLGRRCYANSFTYNTDGNLVVPVDKNGRGFNGLIGSNETGRRFQTSGEMIAEELNSNQRIFPIIFDGESTPTAYILEEWLQDQDYDYVMTKDYDSLLAYIQKVPGSASKVEKLGINGVTMMGCWDINPASFHVALLTKIGKEGTGLVMDRTRSGQVWNQPVYKAEFKIGDLIDPSTVETEKTRAPGVKYIATVTAKVHWISEPTQQMVYGSNFDKTYSKKITFNYVLEFDRKKKLIGGEWKKGADLEVPDFIFGFEKGTKPVDDATKGFDYSGIIAKIHECSLANESDGEITVKGVIAKYKNCDLTKK